MMQSQDQIFLASEGDAWFRRNVQALSPEYLPDWPLNLLGKLKKPASVIEIGCSNGWRLAEVAKTTGARVIGVEPSAEAIRDGKKKYTGIEFVHASAATMPTIQPADVTIVNFVLHWIDRANLLRSVANIDACVRDQGYLILSDFLPDEPSRTRYHHLPKQEVFTFKQDYEQLFLATGLYASVEKVIFRHADHSTPENIPANERAVCVVLQKNLIENYMLGSAPTLPGTTQK